MPKTIEFDGKQHVFPDDFSDADISAALSTGQPQQPQGVARAFTHGAATGFLGSPGTLGDIGEMGAQGIGWLEKKLGIQSRPELYETGFRLPRSADIVKGVEEK